MQGMYKMDFNDRINVTMHKFASISMALTLLPH